MSEHSHEVVRHVPFDLLGKSPAVMTDTERIAAALKILAEYSYVDGDDHQKWLDDQVVRILTGCPFEKSPIHNTGDRPWTTDELGESEDYKAYIATYSNGEDGPNTYQWSVGIAP